MSAKPALPLDVIRSAPPHVARVFDFSDWQATHPLEPLPGDSVDAEFDHTNATANAIIDRLALIQRDDGQLLNGIVTLDAMDPAVLAEIQADVDAAAGSASAAAASATNAATSETNAEAAATAAAASEDNAADSAAAAISAKVDAEAARDAAAASAAEAAEAQAAIEEVFILPSPADANKTIWINEDGTAYVLGEAIRYSGLVWLGEDRRLSSLADPVDPQDAATKQYVIDSISGAGSVPPPAGADAGKFLKATAEDTFSWQAAREVPADSTNGFVLRTDGASYSWTAASEVPIPVGGDAGKFLKATGAGAYSFETAREVPVPADPADNAKVLLANAGLFGWTTFLVDWLGGIAAFMLAFLKTANAPAALAALGGQPSDATLTALAGVATVANDKGKMIQIDGADAFAVAEIPYAYKNAIINPNGAVNQRANIVPNASAYQYFVDRWAVACASAITTGATFGSISTGFEGGYYFGANLTVPAVANTIHFRQRIEAGDAIRLSSDTVARRCSLRFKAFQNSGAAQGVYYAINKANAADNFGAVTAIVGQTLIGTPLHNTITECKAENIDLGDCRNGVELFIIMVVPASAAGKIFAIGDVQLEPNPRCTSLELRPRSVELALCQRFYEKSFQYATAPQTALGGGTGEWIFQSVRAGANGLAERVPFKTRKRATPTVTFFNPINANSQVRDLSAGADCSSSSASQASEASFSISTVGSAGTGVGGVIGVHWTADAEL